MKPREHLFVIETMRGFLTRTHNFSKDPFAPQVMFLTSGEAAATLFDFQAEGISAVALAARELWIKPDLTISLMEAWSERRRASHETVRNR